jgi:ubiquinone/menaquinone biosynthesis C-methylase UbiE
MSYNDIRGGSVGKPKKSIVDIFNQDILDNDGYKYTTNDSLSSKFATSRITAEIFKICDLAGQRIIDIGCGDGTYTMQLFLHGKAGSIHGIDPASEAIKLARKRTDNPRVLFDVQSGEKLQYLPDSFDIAILRGVLHHSEDPIKILKEALRVAPMVVVIDPNGNNLILKLIEKLSPYHIEHKERSFLPLQLHRWAKSIGGRAYSGRYVGIVPCFCPDLLAKILKFFESGVERLPLVNALGCAVYIFAIKRIR